MLMCGHRKRCYKLPLELTKFFFTQVHLLHLDVQEPLIELWATLLDTLELLWSSQRNDFAAARSVLRYMNYPELADKNDE